MGVIEKQSIQDIADAIRDRNGLTTLYKPRQMDEAILGLYKTEAVNHVFDDLRVNTTKENTSFTLDDAEGEAEITELQGNTTQEGTPTPSNPVEVKTVGGDNNIVVSNKNIIPNNIETQTISGVTITKNQDGSLLLNGTSTATIRLNLVENYNIEQGSYIWSINKEGTISNTAFMSLLTTGTTTELSGSAINLRTQDTETFTINEKTNIYARLYIGSGRTFTNFKIYPMLEKGTVATEYTEHEGSSYRVDLGGTNKFNYQYSQLRNINRATISEETNGFKLTSTGVAGYGFASLPIDNSLLGKTVTISCTSTGNKTPSARLFYHNSSGSLTSNIGAFWTTNISHTVTLPSTLPSGSTGIDIVFYISQGNNAEGDYVTFTNIQIVEGNQAKPYSPYTDNPIELCKIGNYQDKIKLSTGKNLFVGELVQGTLNSSGAETSSTTMLRSASFSNVQANNKYTINGNYTGTVQAIIYEYNNSTYLQQITSSWSALPYTFTTSANTNQIKVVLRYSNNGTIVADNVKNVQLELRRNTK